MTAEQRQYLKRAIDENRRAAMIADGDPKFRHLRDEKIELESDRLRPLVAMIGFVNLVVLMSLALMVEHLVQ